MTEQQNAPEANVEVKKPGSAKKIVGVVAAVAIAAGGFFAYQNGLIPGLVPPAKKAADELETEINALKGNGFGKKYAQVFNSMFGELMKMGAQTEEQKKAFDESFTKAFEGTTLDFKIADKKAEDGKGVIILKDVVQRTDMSALAPAGSPPMPASEYRYSDVKVSKSPSESRYWMDINGTSELYMNMGGEMTKIVSFTADNYNNEVLFGENNSVKYMKSAATNFNINEGRGGTSLAKIGNMNLEITNNSGAGNTDLTYLADISNIIPGDMVKMMLGEIEPLSMKMDFSYKGEDLTAYVKSMQEEQKRALDAMQAQAANPDAASQEPAKPEIKSFQGDVKIGELSLKMGDAGLISNASLQFKKENKVPIPYGDASVTVAQYQKLIDYFSKFFPVPPEEINKGLGFLREVGEDKNGSITVAFKFDGTENVLVGGKTEAELQAIHAKYFAPVDPAAVTAPSAEAPATTAQ